jgi:hypothetical protein
VYIKKDRVVIPWKDFNKNMAISVEYNLEYWWTLYTIS